MRGLLKLVKGFCIGLIAIMLVAAVIIQIDQYVGRRRAERLLADFRSVEVRKTTFEEALKMFQKWDPVEYDSSKSRGRWCDENGCDFVFYLEARPLGPAFEYWSEELLGRRIGRRLYMILGGRSVLLDTTVTTRNEIVWRKMFGVSIRKTPDEWADGFAGMGNFTWSSHPPDDIVSNLLLHRGYMVGTENVHAGDYGERHVAQVLSVTLRPSSDSSEVLRLMDFDLECMTRWIRPCRSADLMPRAWAQHELDLQTRKTKVDPLPCTSKEVKAFGIFTEAEAEVQVISDQVENGKDESFRVISARVLQRIRWPKNMKNEEVLHVWVVQPETGPRMEAPPQATSGTELLLLFNRNFYDPRTQPPQVLLPCGALPLSSENRMLVDSIFQENEPKSVEGQQSPVPKMHQ